ncbi:glycine cleavage system protein GcvH [Clostridium ljungdahlii]|uniref:Glycine cleavage system H protein n=1 Tax=Clostridium ljungdahlii TaxID=1538 RepID=A0A170NJJ5_9CLOT|nr:glycine cleavage system protein GcvH [Clostridium ljungdahlii]OAA90273.1 Glycine cleavage system H protein [Clostridium ljungdahlii]
MSKSYAILPCNGLDKCAGCISKEVAIKLIEVTDSEIICPVLYRAADARYNKIAKEKPLLVIDGCSTRCASKLASEKGLKIAQKINISNEAKANNITISNNLKLEENELNLVNIITNKLIKEETKMETENSFAFPKDIQYEIYKKDKFTFRVPKEGFYFNENDCWVYVVGNRARIGVADYVQHSLSDIIFFEQPSVGSAVEQFDEAGCIESGKAAFEVVCPVSGTITAINENLIESPELINESPYEEGWIAEIELSDFESDKELLYDFDKYFEVLKRKVDEFHV